MGSVGFSGLVTKFRYLRAGGATLSLWEAEPAGVNFVGAEAGPARFAGHRQLQDGDEILIDGRSESFVIEHAREDMVYFQAMVRHDAGPWRPEYEPREPRFIGATSTNEASSRTPNDVSLLRAMEREDALPLMAGGSLKVALQTRWHVMREMLALDAGAALPALRPIAVTMRIRRFAPPPTTIRCRCSFQNEDAQECPG